MVLIQYKLIQFFYQSYCFRRAIENKAAYDNPPIADDQERRIDNAIEYNQSRGWSLQVSADKAGVTKSLLQWYNYELFGNVFAQLKVSLIKHVLSLT